jgi:hypothetical protein
MKVFLININSKAKDETPHIPHNPNILPQPAQSIRPKMD